jgi:hypothetical protein
MLHIAIVFFIFSILICWSLSVVLPTRMWLGLVRIANFVLYVFSKLLAFSILGAVCWLIYVLVRG